MNQKIADWYAQQETRVRELAEDIFKRPELSGEERYACMRTAAFMEEYGFEVKKIRVPPAKEDNGVIATWGSGAPVIGILGEYDALPGLGQESVPYRSELAGPGHGCGHCNMNAACASAAAALKAAMEQEHLPGTIVYLACPAEENLSGKVHMLAEGWFDGIDVCLAWHDGERFRVAEHVNQAMSSIRFAFHGKAAHAACNPAEGRSALDAAQLMNMGVEFLREHMEDHIRIHYVFDAAGERPNVVPDYASLIYYVRAANRTALEAVQKRILAVAEGAALMTGTKAVYQILGGGWEPVLNHTLNRVMYQAAQKVPQIRYSDEDRAFARELYRNVTGEEPGADQKLIPEEFQPLLGHGFPEMGSTDVNDVSQVIPTVQLFGGGTVCGLPGHHWSLTAAAGSPIGQKAAVYAGKIIAQCGYDILKDPGIVAESKEEFAAAKKKLPAYRPVLPREEPVWLGGCRGAGGAGEGE